MPDLALPLRILDDVSSLLQPTGGGKRNKLDTKSIARVRCYQDSDFDRLLHLWRCALPLDALSAEDFRARVLLDENRDQDSLLVAEGPNGEVCGFILSLVLRHPIEKVGLLPNRGFITAFGVEPSLSGQGIGSALLLAAEEFFRRNNRTEIVIAPYVPNYFVPSVDREAYAPGIEFLKRRGFTVYSEAIAMDAMIGRFQLDERMIEKENALRAEGLEIIPLPWNRLTEYLAFMNETMPGDWIEDARRLLIRMARGDAPPHSIYVASDHGRIVGYCKFDGEHFGPFGVADSHQGRGLGTILLARTLLQMRIEGHHSAFVLWTGQRAADGVYRRLGFTISRRFDLMKKSLS